MHNADQSIYQMIIDRLEKNYVSLTQGDRRKIQEYLNGLENDEIVDIIKHHITN